MIKHVTLRYYTQNLHDQDVQCEDSNGISRYVVCFFTYEKTAWKVPSCSGPLRLQYLDSALWWHNTQRANTVHAFTASLVHVYFTFTFHVYRHFALAMFRYQKRQFAPDPTCVSLVFFNFYFHNFYLYFHS